MPEFILYAIIIGAFLLGGTIGFIFGGVVTVGLINQ